MPQPSYQKGARASADSAFPRVTPVVKKKSTQRRIDMNVDELDRIIDAAMRGVLHENDGRTLKTAVHAMEERWCEAEHREVGTRCRAPSIMSSQRSVFSEGLDLKKIF